MKKILLIGDSIRMGYDKYVKEALSNVADVYYPDENCKFAVYVLRFAHEWKEKLGLDDSVDLVHWNAGLWDMLELFGDAPLTSIDYYGEAIGRIHARLRSLFPKAKIIFATSTAVIDGAAKVLKRHNDVIKRYNDRALEALKDKDCSINDLYSITINCPESYHSDPTHYYTPAATEMIGGKVLAAICKELGIAAKDVNIENFEPEKYSAANIGG